MSQSAQQWTSVDPAFNTVDSMAQELATGFVLVSQVPSIPKWEILAWAKRLAGSDEQAQFDLLRPLIQRYRQDIEALHLIGDALHEGRHPIWEE